MSSRKRTRQQAIAASDDEDHVPRAGKRARVEAEEQSDLDDTRFQEIELLRAELQATKQVNRAQRLRIEELARLLGAPGQEGPMADVPAEIVFEVLKFLTPRGILDGEMVCKKWQGIVTASMREIDMSPFNSAINNTMVQHLAKYKSLERLCLRRCKDVTADILPMIVASFTQLTALDLYSCQISDFSGLAALGKLRVLKVGDCPAITDAHLKTLPAQVTSLDISWCPGIQHEGLANIAHMNKLIELRIEQNDFIQTEGLVLPDTLVPTLRSFEVVRQGWFLDGALDSLQRFVNLESLALYWTPFSGQGFRDFRFMTALRTLKLRRCHVMDALGMEVMTRNLPQLRALEFTGVHQVDRAGFQHLARMTSLTSLLLRTGRSVIDENGASDLAFLASLRLHSLEIVDGVGITDLGIQCIAASQKTTLEALVLSGCNLLHTSDMLPLQELTHLRHFRLDHCHHLAKANEDFQFTMVPGGGMAIVVKPPPAQVVAPVRQYPRALVVPQQPPANLPPVGLPFPALQRAQARMGQAIHLMARAQMQQQQQPPLPLHNIMRQQMQQQQVRMRPQRQHVPIIIDDDEAADDEDEENKD